MSAIHAFPSSMAECVEKLVQVLARGQIREPSETVMFVCVVGESLRIPYRVYYDKQQLVRCINDTDEVALIARCLGTRHYDGFLREQCARHLLMAEEIWTVPFVVQLLGEYLIEVAQPIQEHLAQGVGVKYIDFCTENISYCAYLECRAISYWNAYYRRRFLKYTDYPGVRGLRILKAAVKKACQ